MITFLKKLTILSQVILSTLFLIILGVLILSINRGFDFTDEGGFLLSYSNVEIYRGGVYNYHIIISKLTEWFKPNVLEFRLISITLTIISSLVLTAGFQQWVRKKYETKNLFSNFLFLFAFLSIGNFLFYFPGILTIYNNTLTNFILQTSTGLFLYLISRWQRCFRMYNKYFIIIGIIGFLCSFSFFIKFPTGILQIFLYLFLILFFLKNQKIKIILFTALSFISGIFMGFIAYFWFFQERNEWWINFIIELNILSDHSSLLLLKNYFFELYAVVKFSLKYFAWLLIFPILILLNNLYRKQNLLINKWLKIIFILFSVILFLYQAYILGFFQSLFSNKVWVNPYLYLIIIGFQLILLFSFKYSKWNTFKFHWSETIILILLLITPVIGAVGTANPIFSNSLIHAAPWFGVMVILSIDLYQYIKRIILVPIFILIPSLITTSQIIDGNLFAPYYSVFNQNKANFFEQNEKVSEIPLLDDILIDKKSKTFLSELQLILNKNNFKKGDPILGFHMPGVVYLMEGISPGVPYFYNKDRDIKAVKYIGLGKSPPVIMLTEGQSINGELLKIMQIKGIQFPHEYVEKGKVYFPNTDSMLTVYFPRNY